MPPLDFHLTDEDGKDVDAEDFQGKTTLLFFGYTHCPDVCPITLARLATAFRQVDDKAREDIQVLFVSVDPARDTPEIMKEYTNAFGPQFIGLTGSKSDIDAITNRYRVSYEYGEKDESGNYDVTHSSATFAFNREGDAQLLIRDDDPMKAVVSDLEALAEGS
ncbi:SCO family protein [Halomonas binhaiensis]|uniref:SCO family protein n=2 Tax=Halomonas binhaiensis TaxID=2562282 RepID=A0A856QMK3_9GAMM|nr:SCO family protein [Halomonas binhaiensis]